MEPLSRLAEAGRQILAQRHGPKMNDQDRMQQALEANRDYIMSADAWERDGWVQGAAAAAQQADLEAIAADRAEQQKELGRRIVAMDPLGQTREAIERATAAGERARQAEFDRQAWQAAITTPTGAGMSDADKLDAMVADFAAENDRAEGGGGGGPNALTRALSPDRLAGMAAEEAARESLARSQDRAVRHTNTMYGTPVPMVDEQGAVLDPGVYVPAAAREGGWVDRQQGRMMRSEQRALEAMYDPQRYARQVAPYLGIDPMLAEGLYPSDPVAQVRDFNADQSLTNILMTGDVDGLTAGQRQMQSELEGWNVEQDYLDAGAARDLYSSPVVSTVSEATDLPLATVADVAGDPLWGDYQSAVATVALAMPDATWTDVETEMESLGLPLPTGKTKQVLAKYLTASKVPDADVAG
jgi:hypothetical protein